MPRNRRFATVEKSYITDIERERCKKVAAAYAELYELESILVLDVGRYGFVKLQYYTPEYGFNDVITYTDSESMFEDLWQGLIPGSISSQRERRCWKWDMRKSSNVCRRKNRKSF